MSWEATESGFYAAVWGSNALVDTQKTVAEILSQACLTAGTVYSTIPVVPNRVHWAPGNRRTQGPLRRTARRSEVLGLAFELITRRS
jgi:hypothetical protein